MRKFCRKADFILLALLLVIGAVATIYISSMSEAGSEVIIKVKGELYGTYPLAEDRSIEVLQEDSDGGGHAKSNIINISGGKVTVSSASCKNQVCVEHAPISITGESIICLPNRVVVTIEGDGDGFDAVTK